MRLCLSLESHDGVHVQEIAIAVNSGSSSTGRPWCSAMGIRPIQWGSEDSDLTKKERGQGTSWLERVLQHTYTALLLTFQLSSAIADRRPFSGRVWLSLSRPRVLSPASGWPERALSWGFCGGLWLFLCSYPVRKGACAVDSLSMVHPLSSLLLSPEITSNLIGNLHYYKS